MWLNTMCARRVSFDPQASQPDTHIQCVGNCKPTQRPSWHLAIQQGYFVIMPLSLVENHATVIVVFTVFSLFYGPRTERPNGGETIAQHNGCAHAHKHTVVACELSKTGCETVFSSVGNSLHFQSHRVSAVGFSWATATWG